MTGFFFYTTGILFIFVCVFLILLILIQKGRGGGLASAFGGAGGNTAFGSKTGDVLTWATSIVFGIFIVLAVVLNLISNTMDERHQLQAQRGIIAPAAPTPAAPAGPSMPIGPGGTESLPLPAEPAAPATAAPSPAPASP